MSSDFKLRPWSSADIASCHRIALKASGPKAWTLKAYNDSFAIGHDGYVCERGGEVVGCLVARTLFEEAEIFDLQVLPVHQGSAAARQLLQAFFQHCRARQVVHILLEVRASNHRAIAFYLKHSFQEIDRRQLYYAARGDLLAEDGLVLRLTMDKISSF